MSQKLKKLIRTLVELRGDDPCIPCKGLDHCGGCSCCIPMPK